MPQCCKQFGCKKGASFGQKDSKTPHYCATHKPIDYINVKTQKYLKPGCNTYAIFNVVDSDKGKFCVKHRQPEMIDIQTKLYKYTGCQKKVLFVIEGSPQTFCDQYK
ncbi:hypothetical protein C1645_831895 [Glomus cerebriforme]|uniref:Uncharacterized protein n=1 Tax=Glomus cerebriforme TaxID=658196 RepID=A0A397SGK6_9GLOM|nr:hypothetical protein C1645_831895 [Glomus cerebriforme]